MLSNEKEEMLFKLKTPLKNYIIRTKMAFASFMDRVAKKLINLNHFDLYFYNIPFSPLKITKLTKENFNIFLSQKDRKVKAISKFQLGKFNIKHLTFLYRKKYINQPFIRLLIQKGRENKKERAKTIKANFPLFTPAKKLLLSIKSKINQNHKVTLHRIISQNSENKEKIEHKSRFSDQKNESDISRDPFLMISNISRISNEESNKNNISDSFILSEYGSFIGKKYITSNETFQNNEVINLQTYKSYTKFPIEIINSKGKEVKKFYFSVSLLGWKKNEIERRINYRTSVSFYYHNPLIKIVDGDITNLITKFDGKYLVLIFKDLHSYKVGEYSSILEIVSKTTKEKLCQRFTIYLKINKS